MGERIPFREEILDTPRSRNSSSIYTKSDVCNASATRATYEQLPFGHMYGSRHSITSRSYFLFIHKYTQNERYFPRRDYRYQTLKSPSLIQYSSLTYIRLIETFHRVRQIIFDHYVVILVTFIRMQ